MTFTQKNEPISIKGQGHYKIFAGIKASENSYKSWKKFTFKFDLRVHM